MVSSLLMTCVQCNKVYQGVQCRLGCSLPLILRAAGWRDTKDMEKWHCLNCVIANEWPTPEAFPLQAFVLLGWVCEHCIEHAMYYRLGERELSSESNDSGVEQDAENHPDTKLESLLLDECEFSSESGDSGVEQHAENPPDTKLERFLLDECEFSSESDDSEMEQPAENSANIKQDSLVQIQLMKMRRPEPQHRSSIGPPRTIGPAKDHRSESTVAEAVLKLLEVRAATFTGFYSPFLAESGREMTEDELSIAWNNHLQAIFRDDMDDHEDDDEHLRNRKRRKINHRRFKAWLSLRFGPHEEIRNVLRNGCPRSVIEGLHDLCEPF